MVGWIQIAITLGIIFSPVAAIVVLIITIYFMIPSQYGVSWLEMCFGEKSVKEFIREIAE